MYIIIFENIVCYPQKQKNMKYENSKYSGTINAKNDFQVTIGLDMTFIKYKRIIFRICVCKEFSISPPDSIRQVFLNREIPYCERVDFSWYSVANLSLITLISYLPILDKQ